MQYVICTDSACDIKPSLLEEWGVPFASLTFRFDGDDTEYSNYEMPVTEFYDRMRAGGVAKTAAVNAQAFKECFEPLLSAGNDILYLGFSTGLSTTYNSARLAAEELRESYPDRKILTVDTLSASAGFGLLLYLTLQKKQEGATLEEAGAYAQSLVPQLCHWFTVEDLVYLKRGGRISPTVAFVGNMLGIKPVLHMDNEGHLINRFKVRGRKTSVLALADKYGELAQDPTGGTVFISNADCLKDAQELASVLTERHGVSVKLIADVGPVIGAHSGPGTLALFFLGKER
jgi:DegV family protein with EDD domain